MKTITLFFFVSLLKLGMAQDTCSIDNSFRFEAIPEGTTFYFHENGTISRKYKVNSETTISKTWDSCGHLVRKIKSGKSKLRKIPYTKFKRYQYYPNGRKKCYASGKMVGCSHYKRMKRREFDENGKRKRSH